MNRTLVVVCVAGCGGSSTGDPDAPAGTADAMVDANVGGTYEAFGLLGGLDRLRINRTEPTLCFMVQLVSPGANPMGLTLPNSWGLDLAVALQPPAACNPGYLGPIANMFDATSQSGSVAWQGAPIPTTVDAVDVTLVFAGNPAWCPPSATLQTSSLPVQ